LVETRKIDSMEIALWLETQYRRYHGDGALAGNPKNRRRFGWKSKS
jgi:hypothetical protein